MKQNFIPAAWMLFSSIAVLPSCSKEAANPVTRDINVSGFDKVTAGDDNEVIITAGNTFSMQARGDLADVNELRTAIASKNLTIDYPVYRSSRKRVHIHITMPTIKMLDLGGACYGNASGFHAADTMKVSLSGDSKFTVNANIALFDVNVSGTSALTINGSANKLVADASGQANYYGYNVQHTNTALVWTSGQANAYVYAHEALQAEASGQSRIFYKGNPPQRTLSATGQAMIVQQ